MESIAHSTLTVLAAVPVRGGAVGPPAELIYAILRSSHQSRHSRLHVRTRHAVLQAVNGSPAAEKLRPAPSGPAQRDAHRRFRRSATSGRDKGVYKRKKIGGGCGRLRQCCVKRLTPKDDERKGSLGWLARTLIAARVQKAVAPLSQRSSCSNTPLGFTIPLLLLLSRPSSTVRRLQNLHLLLIL